MDGSEPARSYESGLQGVGAYLDSECATQFKLLETPAGFAVHYEVRGGQPEERVAFFRFSELRKSPLDIDFGHKIRRPLGTSDRKYRHLLSAVGHELDASRALCILLDELPDALLITYEYDDPKRGYVLRKRMTLAGPRDRERLLNEAHHRRTRLRRRPFARWQPHTDVSGLPTGGLGATDIPPI